MSPPVPKPAAAKPRAKRPAASRPAAARPSESGRASGGGLFRRRVPQKVLTQFTNQLSTLVAAGLPLVRCLRILEGQTPTGPFREIVEAVADDVEGGAALSESLSKHPHVFDRLYVNMVRAGEASGLLGTILERLAEFSRKSQNVRAQVRGAMTYPVMVMGFALLVVTAVMVFVVPNFEGIYTELGATMPPMTAVLLTVARSLGHYWYLYLAVPFLLFVLFGFLSKRETVAYQIDRLKLAIPLFGRLMRKSVVARFTRTMGTLLESGVPILESLSIVRSAIPNRVLADAVEDVHDSIREGETIARPLGESGVFDDIVVNMIDVGEETGQLDTMLLRIADNYDDEVDLEVTTVIKAIEPLLLIAVALLVGAIVVALFLPLVGIMQEFTSVR